MESGHPVFDRTWVPASAGTNVGDARPYVVLISTGPMPHPRRLRLSFFDRSVHVVAVSYTHLTLPTIYSV